MIHILLCSEGVSDSGHDDYQKGGYKHQDGVLQIFMRRQSTSSELAFYIKSRRDIKQFQLIPKKFEGKMNLTSRKIAALAQHEHCHHIAFHRDEDNKGFQEMYNQVHECFSVAKDSGMKCLAIVPMHMTESWLLADERSFPAVPGNPELPKKPEQSWGTPDSKTHPKNYLRCVLMQFHIKPSAETFADLAKKVDIAAIRQKCPISFEKFFRDMQGFLN